MLVERCHEKVTWVTGSSPAQSGNLRRRSAQHGSQVSDCAAGPHTPLPPQPLPPDTSSSPTMGDVGKGAKLFKTRYLAAPAFPRLALIPIGKVCAVPHR